MKSLLTVLTDAGRALDSLSSRWHGRLTKPQQLIRAALAVSIVTLIVSVLWSTMLTILAHTQARGIVVEGVFGTNLLCGAVTAGFFSYSAWLWALYLRSSD